MRVVQRQGAGGIQPAEGMGFELAETNAGLCRDIP